MRLRTLPLSLAGIIAGIALASDVASLEIPVVVMLILTTIGLQVLSNTSNELGDTLSGTDTADRQGIRYALQDGDITVDQMKKFIGGIVVFCCISGAAMTWLSFKTLFGVAPLCILALGVAAIWAAMCYTLGKNPYGYRAKGDYSVFIFFGLATVLGAAYICSHQFRLMWLLPAAAFGCWSVAVLNVNNIRDMKTDAATRQTIAIKLGLKNARIYQTILITLGWALMIAYTVLDSADGFAWYRLLTFPLFVIHLVGVWKHTEKELDPLLPLLVLSTFATAILLLF